MGLYCIRPMVGVSRKHLRAAGAASADRRDAALEHARFVNSHAGRQSGDVADARLRVLRNVQPAARRRHLPHSGRYGLGGKGENGRGADCS